MPHTKGKFEQDLGYTDGVLVAGVDEISAFAAADAVKTRNDVADISFNQAAQKDVTYCLAVGKLLHRTGTLEDLEVYNKGTGIAGNADVQGRPPFRKTVVGKASWLTPRAANKLKGVKVTAIRFAYKISDVDLTTLNARVDKVVYDDNVGAAPAVSAVVASTGLYKVKRDNLIVRTLTLASPAYLTTDLSELMVELNVVTPLGSTFRLYRMEVMCEFNYN
jgi:hypothetical protein